MTRFPFGLPDGWFPVAYADEIARGDVRRMRYFARELVLFRTQAGRVAVLLHLLSPAGRPVQVTQDLASFWAEGYRAVRADLRGRYPRHSWPDDPLTAPPTRRTRRRMEP